jgi:hypothetical protein
MKGILRNQGLTSKINISIKIRKGGEINDTVVWPCVMYRKQPAKK